MKPRKNTFEEELVNIITPYVVQPEQGTAEFIIIEVLNKINDKLSYTCNNCLNEMDEFYGRMYGASKIDVESIEAVIYNLECMREYKKEETK